MAEMTDNPDRSMNSDERAPTTIDNNSELMTEAELIRFLRIPEISNSKDHHNVIENLKRMHQLPRIHICGKPLYPREAIKEWVKRKTINGE
jgi:hypothetical protein